MTINPSGSRGPAWKKLWMEYSRNLKTIETLEGALEMARTSARALLAEVRQLVEDEMRGPAPTVGGSQSSGGKLLPHRRP